MSNISEQTSLRKIFWLCVQEIPYPLNFNERPPQIYLANNSSSFSLFIVPTSGNYQRTNSEHNSQCLGCQLVELLIARHFRFQSESNEKKTWTKFELVEKKHVTTSRLTLVKITPQRKKLRFQIHYSVRPKGSEKARTWIEVDLFTCYIILSCVTYKTHNVDDVRSKLSLACSRLFRSTPLTESLEQASRNYKIPLCCLF